MAVLGAAVCSPDPPVLTLISVPLNVRSGSVSARVYGIDFGRPEWFSGVFQGGLSGSTIYVPFVALRRVAFS